jgi:hypothetical protein
MPRRDLSQPSFVDAMVNGSGRGRLTPTRNGFVMGTNDASGG